MNSNTTNTILMYKYLSHINFSKFLLNDHDYNAPRCFAILFSHFYSTTETKYIIVDNLFTYLYLLLVMRISSYCIPKMIVRGKCAQLYVIMQNISVVFHYLLYFSYF